MIQVLIAIPIFILVTIIQTAIISNMPLLQGTADIIMLVIIAWALQEPVRTAWYWSLIGGTILGFTSALPLGITIVSYLIITGITLIIRRRIWKIPALVMLAITFIGTLFHQGLSAITLTLLGTTLPILETLELIIMPSILLNILLAIPVFAIVRDLAAWLHPEEVEI
ncbi:MAG: hypothetical protein ABFS03_02175 [Chloroflexota bacterium]